MWDKPKEKLLRQLWTRGLSASKISSLIPGTTRNSIIGKSYRLGLEARSRSRKSDTTNNTKVKNFPQNNNQKLGRKARFRALLLDPSFEKENPVQISGLTDQICRWPIGHPGDDNFYFCGRTILEQTRYCKLHFLFAYQKKDEKEEDKVTEEDIPSFLEKKVTKSA